MYVIERRENPRKVATAACGLIQSQIRTVYNVLLLLRINY